MQHKIYIFSEDTLGGPHKNIFQNNVFYMTVTFPRGQYINSLWLSDTIWWHRSGSTVVQVMTCYLNHFSLLISEVQWHSPETNSTERTQTILCVISLEIILLKLLPHLPGAHELIDLCSLYTSGWIPRQAGAVWAADGLAQGAGQVPKVLHQLSGGRWGAQHVGDVADKRAAGGSGYTTSVGWARGTSWDPFMSS